MATVEVIPSGELEFAKPSLSGGRLAGEPVFYGKGSDNANILLVLVRDVDGNIVRRYLLRISGRDFKLSLQERSNPVPATAEGKGKVKPVSASPA